MTEVEAFYKHAANHLSNYSLLMALIAGMALMGSIWAITDASTTKQEARAEVKEAVRISREQTDWVFRQYEMVMVYERGLHADLKAAGFEPPPLPVTEARPE